MDHGNTELHATCSANFRRLRCKCYVHRCEDAVPRLAFQEMFTDPPATTPRRSEDMFSKSQDSFSWKESVWTSMLHSHLTCVQRARCRTCFDVTWSRAVRSQQKWNNFCHHWCRNRNLLVLRVTRCSEHWRCDVVVWCGAHAVVPVPFMYLATNRVYFSVWLQSLNDARSFVAREGWTNLYSGVQRILSGKLHRLWHADHVSGWCWGDDSPLGLFFAFSS